MARRNDRMSQGRIPLSRQAPTILPFGGIPGAKADAGIDFRHYVELAQAAEAAKFRHSSSRADNKVIGSKCA
ncbi:hypothetical protein [Cupriavidus consociatus]|uniref:hypothetical protein n=1 Tax=Cupriavidus consociatus TaxID=2821357 RepID=UPI001AE8957A|nr:MULTISPECIES: hypothetical protein [unclassified Cupriavidus]MBP0625295.1 hypothetical protein [Cupriavidus sp. LEh25]MDK2662028.1 hypothetical protein [Cupriavidus sp. LEh21]